MNSTNTFFNRDQSIAKVNMAMNYLSRCVRENMTIYDYDSQTGKAYFLTNSDKLIQCVVVSEGGNVSLQDIKMDVATTAFSNERVDEQVDGFVEGFIKSLRVNEYGSAEDGFTNLLGAFEGRSKITEARAKLEKRRCHFSESQDIVNTPEFIKMQEVRDHIVTYLKENKDNLLTYEDIVNSLKLTNALGKAFNVPKMEWDEVVEKGALNVPYDSKKSVFEMICTQELIRSELTESKENFSRSWIKNNKISKLASCIYHDDSAVKDALKEAVASVPYIALASKADIKEVFASIYESSDVANISQKDIREYVARVFEFKKPIKNSVIGELNESYGINVQNLKFVPSFANLSKAQSVLFEALAKIGQKETVVRDVFTEVSKVLRKKSGIETLDVNDFVSKMFADADIEVKGELFNDVDLDSVVDAVLDEKRGDKKGDKSNVKKDADDKGDYETGARKGDKSNQKSKKGDKGDFETGARKGDEGDGSHPDRKDFETEKGKSNFGGNKGDKSKTKPGEEDYEDDDAKAKDEFPLAKDKNGKKKPKKKGGALSDEEADAAEDQTAYDEAVEYAEPEEEKDFGSGLSDEGMTDLMGQLEDLFKEIDWSAVANDEEEEGDISGDDYSDEMTEREPNEFSDEEVGTPSEDETP